MQEAKRISKNKSVGTLEMKPTIVNREICTSYLVEKVFPAIRSKFLGQRYITVLVQQDNARPHIYPEDPNIIAAGLSQNYSSAIKMVCKHPNSPDFNVLHLSFYNSIQSL